jgi:hypothetical protein
MRPSARVCSWPLAARQKVAVAAALGGKANSRISLCSRIPATACLSQAPRACRSTSLSGRRRIHRHKSDPQPSCTNPTALERPVFSRRFAVRLLCSRAIQHHSFMSSCGAHKASAPNPRRQEPRCRPSPGSSMTTKCSRVDIYSECLGQCRASGQCRCSY